MSEFFLDELTSEISGAHSITDILILFGDYKVNYFNQKKEFLTEFASNNGLELVNKYTPTWTNGNQETLADHCLTTKHADIGHAETGNAAKKRVVLRREYFY